jgi:RNA polymerase sigma-70 factor (ECF subfamily)
MLRSRSSRHEESLDAQVREPAATGEPGRDPEKEALLADSVGLALLVVLDRLSPAERLAFVLHDMFAVSFEEIAAIVGRTPEAVRQLASRARRRVQGAERPPREGIHQQREIVEAFLRALRARDFEGLVAVLDPEVLVHIDEAARRPGAPGEIRGARNWAKGAMRFAQFADAMEPMLVDGAVGLVWAPNGQLSRVLRFTISGGRISGVEIIADPRRLEILNLGVLQE